MERVRRRRLCARPCRKPTAHRDAPDRRRLQMRVPTDDELAALAEVAAGGISPPRRAALPHPVDRRPPQQRDRLGEECPDGATKPASTSNRTSGCT